jgi:hypothetical protein
VAVSSRERDGGRAADTEELERKLPPPTVEIVPLASTDELDNVIARFKTIRSFTVRVLAPNPSRYKSGGELYDILDAQREAAAASNAQLVYKGPELKRDLVREESAALIGNPTVALSISGEDSDGNKLKQTKEAVSVRVAPEFEPGPPIEIAPEMYDALKTVTDVYKIVDEGKEHAAAVVARVRNLYEMFTKWFD